MSSPAPDTHAGTASYEAAVEAIAALDAAPIPPDALATFVAAIRSGDEDAPERAIRAYYGAHPTVLDAARWGVTHESAKACPGGHVGDRVCDRSSHNSPLRPYLPRALYIATVVADGGTQEQAITNITTFHPRDLRFLVQSCFAHHLRQSGAAE